MPDIWNRSKMAGTYGHCFGADLATARAYSICRLTNFQFPTPATRRLISQVGQISKLVSKRCRYEDTTSKVPNNYKNKTKYQARNYVNFDVTPIFLPNISVGAQPFFSRV